MVHIPGYTIEELLIADGPVSVFDAIRRRDDQPVLLKTVPIDTRGMARVFREELSLLKKLAGPGIIEGLALVRHDEYHCLVYRRRPWVLMKDFSCEQHVGPRVFLEIAIGLAATLAEIHSRGVIHRNVKPMNVFVESDTWRTTLSGFDGAVPAGVESGSWQPGGMKRSLHYFSPE